MIVHLGVYDICYTFNLRAPFVNFLSQWEWLNSLFIPGEKIVLLLIVSYQTFYCPNIKIPEATGNDKNHSAARV